MKQSHRAFWAPGSMQLWPEWPQPLRPASCHDRKVGICHSKRILRCMQYYHILNNIYMQWGFLFILGVPRYECLRKPGLLGWTQVPVVLLHPLEKLIQPIPQNALSPRFQLELQWLEIPNTCNKNEFQILFCTKLKVDIMINQKNIRIYTIQSLTI